MGRPSTVRRAGISWALLVLVVAGCAGEYAAGPVGERARSSPSAGTSSSAPSAGTDPAAPVSSASPEALAPGPRGEVQVTVIGDSIPYGQHFCGSCLTFVDLYAAALDGRVRGTVGAENLSTADDLTGDRLVERITTDKDFRQGVSDADILIVTIGHNDQPWNGPTSDCDAYSDYGEFVWEDYTASCIAAASQRHARRLTAVLDEAHRLRGNKPTVQIVTTDYNDFISHGGDARIVVAKSKQILDSHRRATCQVAARVGAACVDVYAIFNGPTGSTPADGTFLAPDHTHPSADGQRAIARALNRVNVAAVTRK